jgi:MFS family permease
MGGVLTDRLLARYGARSRLLVASVAAASAALSMAALLLSPDKWIAYALTVPFNFLSAMYVAPGAANVNSLVLPRMRATASAAYIVFQVFLGTALGPYVIGTISDGLVADGADGGAALRRAMLLSLLAVVPSVVLLTMAGRTANRDEGDRMARGRALGEPAG